MKYFFLLLACAALITTSCGKDPDQPADVDQNTQTNPEPEPEPEPEPKPEPEPEPEPEPAGNEIFTVSSGWDIYDGGVYRYGPSMIINDDETMDIWFATPGGQYVHEDDIHNYDVTTAHAPISLGASNIAGQKFTVGEPFLAVTVCCPSWGGSPCNLRMSLYVWNSNYATTVAGTPVASKVYTNYADNAWLELSNANKFPAGTYLWVLDQGTTNESGVWYAPGTVAGVTSFLNGQVWGNNYESIVRFRPIGVVNFWDQISYRRFTDGGHTWTTEQMTLLPTEFSYDQYSVCDPGVFKYGDYYYLGYTSTLDIRGTDNDVFISRSHNPNGPWEKWNGSGWTTGTDVQPMIEYTGNPNMFGAGEPSFVVLNNIIYIYYSWNDTGETTRLATASATNPNWPGSLTMHGTVIDKSGAGLTAADAADIKYREDLGKFQAVHTASRITPDSYIVLWQSDDGINNWTKIAEIRNGLQPYLHNCGWSGDAQGHINPDVQQFIAYAYGPNWANWNTFMHPINF